MNCKQNLISPRSFEVAPAPCVLLFFGATGDLTRRKLIPSLFELAKADLLHSASRIVGCARSPHDTNSFREMCAATLPQDADPKERDDFLNRITYVVADAARPETFKDLATHLAELDKLETPAPFNRLFFFAVPPASGGPIIEKLSEFNLISEDPAPDSPWRSLALEKPFGTDTDSAAEFDTFLKRFVTESQIYRVDHYLAKETVQNILMLRFANVLFEPIWNAQSIDHVQITVSETVGLEGRVSYFEEAGLLRDMFQNHLLQMLALIAMEPPPTFSDEALHSEKLKIIQTIRPFTQERIRNDIIRAQYIAGNNQPGYLEEPGGNPNSTTETYVAAKFFIDNWRWRGVPFYIRAGKRLSVRASEISMVFKRVPHSIFSSLPDSIAPNVLTLRVQPEEGVSLLLQAKRPGPKLNMGDMRLKFDYSELDNCATPDAYARLLLDGMLHDRTLFVRGDVIDASWRLFTPVLQAWEHNPELYPLHTYTAGSEGPDAADDLLARDGRAWKPVR